jgi:1-acyl-sn-glycerol-3-phosphate acyltransferase
LKLLYSLRTGLVVAFVAVYLVVVAPLFILHAIITKSPELLYRVALVGVRASMRLAGIRLRVEGAETIPAGVCVFVANHASNVDPPVIVAAIPRRVAVLTKKQVFRIPIFATAMRVADFIPVDRAVPEAAAAAVDHAVGRMHAGVCYLVFPEGSRSIDGRLRAFKKGSFVMAIEAGAAVVPVSIAGSQRIMKKGEHFIRPGEVVVRFGPAVKASEYSMEQRAELLNKVRAQVAAGLPEDQRPADAGSNPANSQAR